MSPRKAKGVIKQLENRRLIFQVHRKDKGQRNGISGYRIASLSEILALVSKLHSEVHDMHHQTDSEVHDMHRSGAPDAQKLHHILSTLPAASCVFNQYWFFEHCRKKFTFDYETFLPAMDRLLSVRWRGSQKLSRLSIPTANLFVQWHTDVMFNGESRSGMTEMWADLASWLENGGGDRPQTLTKLALDLENYTQLAESWKAEYEARSESGIVDMPKQGSTQ
jgi:hypothetical protein